MATSKSYLIKIGADAGAVTKAIQNINGQTSSLKRLAGTLDSAFKLTGDTSVLTARLSALNGAVKGSQQTADKLRAEFAKMSSAADFNPASVSAQKLQARIAQADAETIKLKGQAQQAKNQLDGMANANVGKLESNISSVNGGFTILKGTLAGIGANLVTSALSSISNGVSELAGTMNQNSKAWQTFTGNMKMMGESEADINKTKAALQDFAQKTIFSASDMASTYAQLNAVGTKNTQQLVLGFGGLASAAEDPQQAMKTLSQQATQMAAKPMVQWSDFKLILEQTPAGISAIAKTMGKSTSQLVSDVQAGTVSTQDLFDAIAKTGTNKQFTQMATQFKTVDQAIDGLTESLANKLQPAFDAMSKIGISAIENLGNILQNIKLPTFDTSSFSGIGTIFNQVKSAVSGLDFTSLQNLASAVIPALQNGFQTFLSYVTPAIQPLLTAFRNLWAALQPVVNIIASALMPVLQILGAFIGGFVSGAMGAITTAFNILASVVKFITPVLKFVGQTIQNLAPILTTVAGFIGKLMGNFTAFNGVLGIVGKVVGSVFGGVIRAGSNMWARLSSIFGQITGAFRGLGSALGSVGRVIAGVFGRVVGFAGSMVRGIMGAVSGIAGRIGGAFSGVYGAISRAIGNVTSIGSNIVSGIANGIRGAWGVVTSAISALTQFIPKKIREFLGIHSPSRVMRDMVGKYIPQGIAVGMTGENTYITQKAGELKNQLTNSLSNFKAPQIGLSGGALSTATPVLANGAVTNTVTINVNGGDPNAIVPTIRRELRRNGISTN